MPPSSGARAAPSTLAPTPFGLLEAVCGCPDLFPLYLRQGDDWVQQRFWEHHEEILVASDGRDLERQFEHVWTSWLGGEHADGVVILGSKTH